MRKAIVAGAASGIGRDMAIIRSGYNYEAGITGRREQLLLDLLP